MRHGSGVPIIVGAATGGVPGRSSPPVPLSRWERGNEGRAPGLVRLLGPAERHHAVPPGGRGAARQLGRSVGAGSHERRALRPDPQRAGSDAIGDSRGRLLPATAVECELPRFVRRLPGPECLGCRRECLLGPGRVRRHPPYRSGAGRASAFDTERAQAQLSSTLASIPAREAQVAAAQYRIGTLVGRSPTEVARELEQTAALPQLPEVTSIGTPDVVVRYRPDVAAAERFAAAQGALVGAAKSSYLPRLSIGGTAGYAAPEFSSVGNQGTLRYAVGPVITWPGLNLGRVKAEVDAA